MPLDFKTYLESLGQERYRCTVVHTTLDYAAAQSNFAEKACLRYGGKYFDLLAFVQNSSEINAHLDSFTPEKFKDLLIAQSAGQSFLVIDRADLLLDTWRKAERQAFYRFLKNQWDSYRERMQSVLIFCFQTSTEIVSLAIMDHGVSRNHQLSDFNDIV